MKKKIPTMSFPTRIRGLNIQRESNIELSSFPSVIAKPLKRMKQSLFLSFQNITLSFRRKPESSFILSFLTRIRGINIQQESRLFLSLRGHIVTRLPGVSSIRRSYCLAAISILFFFTLPFSAFAEEKISVFPTTPVEAYTVYGSLALFWLAIIFLIIVIKMKLNEIERIQKLGIDEEDENAPVLE